VRPKPMVERRESMDKWFNKDYLFNRILVASAYIFLFLPFFIFTLGWLQLWIAIPVSVCMIISFVFAVKSTSLSWGGGGVSLSKQNLRKMCIGVGIICVWVILSGIGNFVWQNSDHSYRNEIFKLLVEKRWPVTSIIDGIEYRLVYYIGFWLPAAFIGKVFGLQAGFGFLYLWALFGVVCVFLMVCALREKLSLRTLMIIIFFSGLDYIGEAFLKEYVLNPFWHSHMEWWSGYFQYSSMTTQLFWVFNQTIPAWIATTLLLAQKNNKNLIFIMGTLLLNSTFSFMGLLPITGYVFFRNIRHEFQNNKIFGVCLKHQLHDLFSFQNILGGSFSGIISFIFLSTNVLASSFSLSYSPDKNHYFMRYIWFFILEAGVYLVLCFNTQKKNPLYYVIMICFLLCPLFYIPSRDFVMRASVPSLYILMLMIIDEMESVRKSSVRTVLLLVLVIGSITPIHEIMRTLIATYNSGRNPKIVFVSEEAVMKAPVYSTGDKNKFFFKYLANRITPIKGRNAALIGENGEIFLSSFGSQFEQPYKNEYFISNGDAAYLMYGPYARLRKGAYTFKVQYELMDIDAAVDKVAEVDICTNHGGSVLTKISVNKSDFKNNILHLNIPLMLKQDTDGIEIRTFVYERVILKIKYVRYK
jgi:hypothetical protein